MIQDKIGVNIIDFNDVFTTPEKTLERKDSKTFEKDLNLEKVSKEEKIEEKKE